MKVSYNSVPKLKIVNHHPQLSKADIFDYSQIPLKKETSRKWLTVAIFQKWQSWTIKDDQGLARIMKDYQRLSKTIKDYQGLSRTIKDYQG